MSNDDFVPMPLSSRYSYHAIFSDVSKTRFSYLATYLLLTLSTLISIFASFSSTWDITTSERVVFIPLKLIPLYFALLIVVITRKNYLHVDFLGYSNLISNIYGQVFSIKFFSYQIVFSLSSICISWSVNDCVLKEWNYMILSYYRVTVWMLTPLIYSLQHVMFDLDRLSFNYGNQHQNPQYYISSRLRNSVIKCFIMSSIVFFIQPVCFYLLSLNWKIGFFTHMKCCGLSFFIFLMWEFINICFNAYLSIGCLHKGKPISSLSSTPMDTLVSGLNSSKLFTKLTAFQELSYRATSPDIQMRLPIYHTRYRNSFIWPYILRECLIVCQNVNSDTSNFVKRLEVQVEQRRQNQHKLNNTKHREFTPLQQEDELFGNQHTIAENNPRSQTRLPGSPPPTAIKNDYISHRIILQNNNVLLNTKNYDQSFNFSQLSSNPPIFTQQITIITIVQELINFFTKLFNSFFFPTQLLNNNPGGNFRQLSIFELWQISKRRQAEKLVKLPICYAECIISLMGLSINSLEEDPKGGVVSSVGEVLKILERSVGSLGSFVEWNNNSKNSREFDVITILYDLVINAFLEIVLKYNKLLKDVYLDDDVVKLTKWVLQICNE